jgi:hypothetical protein
MTLACRCAALSDSVENTTIRTNPLSYGSARRTRGILLDSVKNPTLRTNALSYGSARRTRGILFDSVKNPTLRTNALSYGSAMLMRGKSRTCRMGRRSNLSRSPTAASTRDNSQTS